MFKKESQSWFSELGRVCVCVCARARVCVCFGGGGGVMCVCLFVVLLYRMNTDARI